MEPFSLALLISGVTVAIYQMSGTPFLLNVIIFCSVLLLCFYAMFVSGYLLPSDAIFYWIYSTNKKSSVQTEHSDLMHGHDDQITKRLRELTGHIVRDFILSWYNTVTDDVTFVQEAFELFEHLLKGARSRVASTDKDRLLANILTLFLHHYVTYKKAQEEIANKSYTGNDEDNKRRDQLLTIAYLEKNSHRALKNLPDSEMEYLRGVVILVLKGLLPEDYKLTGTPLYLVRELIAQNVLSSLVDLMSDPLWIYNTLVKILDDSEATEEVDQEIFESDVEEGNAMQNTTDEDLSENDKASNTNAENTILQQPLEIETTISTSLASSVSVSMSQASMDSIDGDETLTMGLDDVPLPSISSEMHFGPEANIADQEVTSLQKQPDFIPKERAQPDRLFLRVRIPEATVMKESFDGGGKYTLYRITYKTREKVTQTSAINIPNGEEVFEPQEAANSLGTVQTKRHQVQRRFREFLLLQERLTQNMVAKTLIADINGPSRMFPVPFGNMEKEYIEQRRKFLQAYLREICSIPFISRCKEMKEFLAYEMDPRIAYVKKPTSIPRFDIIFKSAIQDLLGSSAMKFSTSLPENEPVVENEAYSSRKSESHDFMNNEMSNVGAVTKLKNKMFGLSKHSMRDDSSTVASRQFGAFEGQRCVFSTEWKSEEDVHNPAALSVQESNTERKLIPRESGDGCDFIPVTEQKTDSETLSANLLFKLVLHIWNVPPRSQGLVSLTLTKYIQAFLTTKVEDLTTKSSWTKYLETLHEALWPEGEWNTGDSEKMTWESANDDVKSEAEQRARNILEKELPKALRYLVAQNTYKNGVDQVVKSLQNTNINRHIFFQLLDLIVLELFPDLDAVISRNNVSLDVISSRSS